MRPKLSTSRRVPRDWIGLYKLPDTGLRGDIRRMPIVLGSDLPDGVVLDSTPVAPAAREAFDAGELDARIERYQRLAAARAPLSPTGPVPDPVGEEDAPDMPRCWGCDRPSPAATWAANHGWLCRRLPGCSIREMYCPDCRDAAP